MLFNSFSFLIFFPLVTLIYFVLPRKTRWLWLLVTSYYFYMNWNAEYALLLAASTGVTYGCALLIDRFDDKKKRKAVLVAGIRGDYSNVVGLPIPLLAEMLGDFGIDAL